MPFCCPSIPFSDGFGNVPRHNSEKAVYWGTHPKKLKELKQRILKRVKSGKVFNSQTYARKFEALCYEMIQQQEK